MLCVDIKMYLNNCAQSSCLLNSCIIAVTLPICSNILPIYSNIITNWSVLHIYGQFKSSHIRIYTVGSSTATIISRVSSEVCLVSEPIITTHQFSCSKLKKLLVNGLLKFQMLIYEIRQYFCWKNMMKKSFCSAKVSLISFFQQENIGIFGYKVVMS